MIVADDAFDNELSVPGDFVRGARGHAVLAIGPDSDGTEALAMWRLGPTGHADGAWLMRFDEIHEGVERLGQIVALLQDRCVIDWDRDVPVKVIDRIVDLVPAHIVDALRANVIEIPDVLVEIAEQRSSHADAVDRHRATTTSKSKIAPLTWPSEVPTPQELAERSRRTPWESAPPVAVTALQVSAAVARAAQLWQETEQARYRREYLRALGEPQPLPPRWLARLRQAAGAEALAA